MDKGEGRLDIGIAPDALVRRAARGWQAGYAINQRFCFDRYRWIRYLSVMSKLEEQILDMKSNYLGEQFERRSYRVIDPGVGMDEHNARAGGHEVHTEQLDEAVPAPDELAPTPKQRPDDRTEALRESVLERAAGRPMSPFSVRIGDGEPTVVGHGAPAFELVIKTAAGMDAVMSFAELAIAEAYINEDIDLTGDLVAAMSLREILWDNRFWLAAWERAKAAVRGGSYNAVAVARHYDADNIQLFAADRRYGTYTPGIYVDDHDSLEDGAERKLATAYEQLNLRPGHTLLDVGCGWGGFAAYAASRGVEVTGITLSQHQLQHAKSRLERAGLHADLRYCDFFKFDPPNQFDAISAMGVLEDLSDYSRIMRRLAKMLKPTGRIYLDFAASNRRFGVSSFISRYVWPGNFRLVYLPECLRGINAAGLEILCLTNDRRNYALWADKMHERWQQRKAEVLAASSEADWRVFRLLVSGVAGTMKDESARASAHRLVLAFRCSQGDGSAFRVSEPLRRALLRGAPSFIAPNRTLDK